MRKIFILMGVVLLSGCTTPQQQAAARQMELDGDAQQCRSYGLNPRSEAFANCRMELDIARQQRYMYYERPAVSTGIYYGHGRRW